MEDATTPHDSARPGTASPHPPTPHGPTTGPTLNDSATKARDPLADGAQPLADATREAFAQCIVAGMNGQEAYKTAYRKPVRALTATQQASRWIREPAVHRRITWLRIKRAEAAAPVAQAEPAQPSKPAKRERAAPPAASSAQVVDKQELLVMLSHAVRNGQLDGQTLNALLKVHPDLTAGTDQRPDGAMVAAYLAQFGGHKGRAAVEAMGGLPAMARKVAGALGCTLAELGEACRT